MHAYLRLHFAVTMTLYLIFYLTITKSYTIRLFEMNKKKKNTLDRLPSKVAPHRIRSKSRKPPWVAAAQHLVQTNLNATEEWRTLYNDTSALENVYLVGYPAQLLVAIGIQNTPTRTGVSESYRNVLWKMWTFQAPAKAIRDSPECGCRNDKHTVEHVVSDWHRRKCHGGMKDITESTGEALEWIGITTPLCLDVRLQIRIWWCAIWILCWYWLVNVLCVMIHSQVIYSAILFYAIHIDFCSVKTLRVYESYVSSSVRRRGVGNYIPP